MKIRSPAPASGLMTAAACLWLGVFPLWQDLSYTRITHAKWVGMLILCGLTLICAAAETLRLARQGALRQRLQPKAAQALAALYVGWVALSAWQGRLADTLNSRGEAAVLMGAVRYEGLYTQLCYGLILLLLSLYPLRLRAILHAGAAGLAVFCGVAALQYAGLNPLGLFPGTLSLRTNYEFQSTIGNIDMVSGYLTLLLPLLFMGYTLTERGGYAWLAAGFTGALLTACMEVQSGLIAALALLGLMILTVLRRPACRPRGLTAMAVLIAAFALRQMLRLPWLDGTQVLLLVPLTPSALALLAGAAVLTALAALTVRHPGRAMPMTAVVCLATAAAVAVAAAVALLPVPQGMGGVWELHECLQGRGQDHFGSWRVGAWRHTLAMAKDSLLFGTGPDTFLYAMNAHLATEGASLGLPIDSPHNEYLAILSNSGLPALALYLATVGAALARALRRSRHAPMCLACAGAVACYCLQAAFSFSVCLVTPMYFAALALCLSAGDE